MVTDYLGYSLNWTVPQMILLCKLTSLAWNYQDGQTPEEVLEKRDRDGYQRAHRLKKLPNLLETFSYAFFFAGYLAGPWSDFTEYISFVDRSMFKNEGGKIPSATRFVLVKFGVIVVALGGYMAGGVFDINWLTTADFASNPWWMRIVYYLMYTEIFYFKYYVVWWLGEGATAVVGLSYNGRDANGNVKWDRIRMLDLIRYKLAKSIVRDCVPSWNMMSQHWLKRYVHQRFVTLGASYPAARLITFLTSALWHGLYPGYYVFFGSCALFNEGSDFMYYTALPYFFDDNGKGIYPRKHVYDWGTTAIIWITIDYLAPTFQLLAFGYGLQALNQIYWFGHVGFVCVIALWFIHKTIFPKHLKKAREIHTKIVENQKAEAAVAAAKPTTTTETESKKTQ